MLEIIGMNKQTQRNSSFNVWKMNVGKNVDQERTLSLP